jgi:S-disulfanyl-L-cysteine oxidoreductase SoxD
MKSRNLLVLFCSSLLLSCTSTTETEGPGLGVPISQEDLAPWDISIEADGSGLPEGSGTVQQGETLYVSQCIACHGGEGAGQPFDRLVGGRHP